MSHTATPADSCRLNDEERQPDAPGCGSRLPAQTPGGPGSTCGGGRRGRGCKPCMSCTFLVTQLTHLAAVRTAPRTGQPIRALAPASQAAAHLLATATSCSVSHS